MTENGRSHAGPHADPPADGDADNLQITDEQPGDDTHAAADSPEPAATEKEKKKKKKNRDQKDIELVESPAPVKKKNKSKKEANGVSMLDLDNADAPWANEPVVAAQPDDVKQAMKAKIGAEGISQQTTAAAPGPVNAGQALALLGFAAAKPLSHKHKKQKKRDC